jgi:hypothetical protein
MRRSISENEGSGGIWAILLGSATAIVQFFLGYIINPGGFGYSRLLFGFVDIVSLPVLIPFVIYTSLLLVRGYSDKADYANFALLWLIPSAALRTFSWISTRDPILLVAVPLLWTALALGLSFFISLMIAHTRWFIIIPSVLVIIVLPILAAFTYWAFFSQQNTYGFLLLIITGLPALISLIIDFIRSR